jgi:hypothetical protein
MDQRFDFLNLGSNFVEYKTPIDGDLRGTLGLLDSPEGRLNYVHFLTH